MANADRLGKRIHSFKVASIRTSSSSSVSLCWQSGWTTSASRGFGFPVIVSSPVFVGGRQCEAATAEPRNFRPRRVVGRIRYPDQPWRTKDVAEWPLANTPFVLSTQTRMSNEWDTACRRNRAASPKGGNGPRFEILCARAQRANMLPLPSDGGSIAETARVPALIPLRWSSRCIRSAGAGSTGNGRMASGGVRSEKPAIRSTMGRRCLNLHAAFDPGK